MFDEISFDNTNDNLDIDILSDNLDASLEKQENEPSVAAALGVIAVTAVGTGLAYYAIHKIACKILDVGIAKAVVKREQKEDNE